MNVVKRDRNFSQSSNLQTPAPDIEQIRRRTMCFGVVALDTLAKTAGVGKTLDELLLEIEQFSQERASHVSDEPGKAIIDTGCGRCVA